jgi:hypothetical protein
MLLRLCQLKSLSLLLPLALGFSSCTSRDERYSSELLTTYPNKWFSANPRHTILDNDGEPVPHLFFDPTPDFRGAEVNVLVLTPWKSPHAYALDLGSGQRFYSHAYCPQTDVWGKYGGTLNRPPFSVGYIPRVLDQLGEPHKVILWSRRSFQTTAGTNFQRARLLGAYVEQTCPQGNCLGKGNWLSRLVFVALDAEEPAYAGVTTLAQFQREVDWETARAALGNLDGRNVAAGSSYPQTRIGELIEFDEAFDYFKKRSILMTEAELRKVQKGCHRLYDALWEEVGKERPEDRAAQTTEALRKKLELREELRKKGVPVGFAARFQKFAKRFGKELGTCERFVYHGNVNRDPEAFWFLSYAGLFFRLHREGYYFDCRSKVWQKNLIDDQGMPVYQLTDNVHVCGDADIDRAMEYLPNFLASLKNERDFYRFIDYDNHTRGTHGKLYSWVRVKAHRLGCEPDPNAEPLRALRVFPDDAGWKPRKVKDISDKMKIIL